MRKLFQFCTNIRVPTTRARGIRSSGIDSVYDTPSFTKLDLRIGNIIKVDVHPGADNLHLLKVEVEQGKDPILISTGLSKLIQIQDMTGLVVVLMNLRRRNYVGIQSEALIVFAQNDTSTELLRPTGQIGDKIFLKSSPSTPTEKISNRLWDHARNDLKTNSEGIVTYKDEAIETKSGPIISKLINAKIK